MAVELHGSEPTPPATPPLNNKRIALLVIGLFIILWAINSTIEYREDYSNSSNQPEVYGVCKSDGRGSVTFSPTIDSATAHEYNQSLNAMGVVSTVCTYNTYKESINNG